MAKEIERAGFPVVVMANLIDVAKTVGSNRIVPTTSVPYHTKEHCWYFHKDESSISMTRWHVICTVCGSNPLLSGMLYVHKNQSPLPSH